MAIVRVNFDAYESGEEYTNRLQNEIDKNFSIFLKLLSSYWHSTVDGPNYAREIKAITTALSQVRIALEDIQLDTSYITTRSEYLYQILTSSLFPISEGIPNLNKTDVEFREFLRQVILVYFKGSIPDSIKKAVELITGGEVIVKENFKEARSPGSGYDISDEFGFSIDIILSSFGSIDIFLADKNIRILLNIIRPAHTLYKIKHILQDTYVGQQSDVQPSKIIDALRSKLSNYSYEDFRKHVDGVEHIDPYGTRRSVNIVGEDHSADF